MAAVSHTNTIESAASQKAWDHEGEVQLHRGRSVLNVTSARFRVAQKRWLRTVSEKDIVSDVSVSVKSGETLAIMGPSGAGKTTFLDLLTMEGSGGVRTGYVDINGEPLTPELFRRCCSYVPQHDRGWAFLTCRETLRFAADFFHSGSRAEKAERVEELLRSMGLESCADTKVGNELVKGLSGGQRRRLSLAVAMMKDPLVLFLDEITSGLDSASAASITNFLQQLARSKDVIIVCTIHQPSAKVFAGFDNLLLLTGGRAAFSGKVKDAAGFFSSLGCQIPEHENPADFLLDSVNADFTDKARVEEVIEAWREARPMDKVRSGSFMFDKLDLGRKFRCWCAEVAVLFRRSATLALRDPTVYLSRIVAFMMACSFFAVVYVKSRNRNQSQVNSRFWLLLWHMGVPCQFSMAAALGQNIELASVRSEVKAGMYRVSSYLAAQHLIQLPFIFVLALSVIGVSGYGIANWDPAGFWQVLLVECLLLFSFECAAQFFGVASRHPLLGMFNVVNFWFASFLFAGFLVPEDDVPMPFRLFATVSPIKWASKAATYAEFSGTEFEGAVLDEADPRGFSCGGAIECYGRTGLQVLNTLRSTTIKHLATEDELLKDCAMLLAIAAAFRLMYFVATWLRCRSGEAVKPPAAPSTAQALKGTELEV